jgi:hypothetical protein
MADLLEIDHGVDGLWRGQQVWKGSEAYGDIGLVKLMFSKFLYFAQVNI